MQGATKCQLVKCSSKSCESKDFYPNQLTDVEAGGVIYSLCPGCYRSLMKNFGCKQFLAVMYRKECMSAGEQRRLNLERAQSCAMRDFDFGGVQ